MRHLTRAVAVLSLLGFVSAVAQAEPPKHGDPKDPIAKQKGDYKGTYCGLRSSTIIGSNVKNPSGEDLGSIEDLAVDPDTGRVVYGVLSFGGFLGMGDKQFAIPISSLDFNHDGFAELSVDKATLESAEGFDAKNWPDMANERWATETHTRYGQKPYWQDQTQQPIEQRPNRIVRLSETTGQAVKNAQDEKVGDIEDIMVDANRSKIAFVVISAGGFLGMGDDLVAVPWSKLQVNNGDDVRMNITKEELTAGPRINKDNWPQREDKNLVTKVYSHYNVEPYWQGRTGRPSDM